MYITTLPLHEQLTPRQIGARIRKANDASVKALRGMEKDAVSRALALLQELRKDLVRAIRLSPTDSFKGFQMDRLRAEIEKQIARFVNIMDQELQKDVGISFVRGSGLAFDRLAHLNAPPILLPNDLLAVTQSMGAEQIKAIGEEARKQIVGVLQRGVLGAKTPFQVAREVDIVIGRTKDKGITYRAERIVRTEINRAYNAADHATRSEVAATVPTLKKMWSTSQDGRVREVHRVMDGVVVDANEPFDVPVPDKKGFPSGRFEKLDYPLDPKGSAGNTINCRCVVLTFPEELEEEFKK